MVRVLLDHGAAVNQVMVRVEGVQRWVWQAGCCVLLTDVIQGEVWVVTVRGDCGLWTVCGQTSICRDLCVVV